MKTTLRKIAGAVVAMLVLGPGAAMAELRIDITQGHSEPVPVAIFDFTGQSVEAARFGRDLTGVIAADLERSGLFRPMDKKAFIQTDLTMITLPRFGDWRVLNAQALIQGSAEVVEDGRLKVQFRLWDVFAEVQMVALIYHTVPNNWRRIAHKIADEVYKRITGEEGYFDTRIVYVAESGRADRRVRRLAIMDQDGENHKFLTAGEYPVFTPRFSPTLQEITYLSFYGNTPRVYIFNLDNGRQELLGDFQGMTFAPRFSPDGKSVVMTLARNGNSEIYVMELSTRVAKQITRHSAIDTSPSFAPDGERIVFNSDRSGAQQLYIMDADGSREKRISFGKGRYATPVWSPRGDLIAFTKILGGEFFIGVMRPDSSGERLLAKGFLVEGPTWSPNGRVLMFFRQEPRNTDGSGGRTRIFSVDLTGQNEREVITPLDASAPAWSPLIPN